MPRYASRVVVQPPSMKSWTAPQFTPPLLAHAPMKQANETKGRSIERIPTDRQTDRQTRQTRSVEWAHEPFLSSNAFKNKQS
mmetsp:Transcript_25963/g.50900  ORF Transcript_25963/g.50900 Transcript_25963/m.50900 type:complete len:82 (-) Transcript_25963:2620-2865(-)